LPLDDHVHRLPRRPADAGPRCGLNTHVEKRSQSASHRIHYTPTLPIEANSAAAVAAGKSVSGPPPTRPTRQSLRSVHLAVWVLHASITAFVHCARALVAFGSAESRSDQLELLVCVGKTRNALPLTLDYVTCTGLAGTPKCTNTNTSHHHVVDKQPHDNNARPPLEMTCYTGIPTITQHTNRQAQAPRKKRHARKARHDVPFLTYLGIHGRHLISQLQVSPHL
jgi:hypothetical protein